MKRVFTIFELSKNEQRVVLIVTFVLIAIAFVRYENRAHQRPVQPGTAIEEKPSPSPVENEDEP
jgi:hypothetical protein